MIIKRIRKNKDIQYYGEHELTDLQNKFFAQFDYNFWMHKALIYEDKIEVDEAGRV